MTIKRPFRYRTAEESRAPGYLAKRMKAYARLQRMQARVLPLRKKDASNG